MGGILTLISSALGAVAGWFGWVKDRQALKNAPAVQAAAVAQNEQRMVDRVNEHIAKGDLEKAREDIAE